jgi:hypothetical protein
MTADQPVEVFISYSLGDENLLKELLLHLAVLKREGAISIWYDRLVTPGNEWVEEIDERFNQAQIIILLISPSYLASDYCYDIEMPKALERHISNTARLIPVILRSSDWMQTPFSKLQVLPENGKPLTSWDNRDEGFTDIVKGIKKVVSSIHDGGINDSFNSKVQTFSYQKEIILRKFELTASKKPRVFISYSREDIMMRDKLMIYLAPLIKNEEITVWSDQMLLPGEPFRQRIDYELNESNIILVLLSPAYLSSGGYREIEFQMALDNHMSGKAIIIPIRLNSVILPDQSPLNEMLSLPRDGKPISMWVDSEEAWSDVVRGIRNVIRNSYEVVPGLPPIGSSNIEEESFENYQIGDIFRTAGTPEFNYEKPSEYESFKIELQTLGKGLAIEGPSGIGKTSTMNEALKSIQLLLPITWSWISAVQVDACELIDRAFSNGFNGYLIIDDFHHLPDKYKDDVARNIKVQSEKSYPNSKIIVIGINRVGHMLMEGFPELAGRVGIIRMDKQSDEKIQSMIQKGEKAANILFRFRSQIVEISNGSFFTAQHLCLYLARKANVATTQDRFKSIDYGPTDVISEVLGQFEFKYRQPLNILASIDTKSSLKGAGLVLLWLLQREGVGYVLISEVRKQYPQLDQSFDRLVETDLKTCFNENECLNHLFFYDFRSGNLVIEDPQLTFYLRNIPWIEFARHAGHEITISDNNQIIFKNSSATAYNSINSILRKIIMIPPSDNENNWRTSLIKLFRENPWISLIPAALVVLIVFSVASGKVKIPGYIEPPTKPESDKKITVNLLCAWKSQGQLTKPIESAVVTATSMMTGNSINVLGKGVDSDGRISFQMEKTDLVAITIRHPEIRDSQIQIPNIKITESDQDLEKLKYAISRTNCYFDAKDKTQKK